MSASEDAREIPPCISTVCHPERQHNYVTCLLCDGTFCRSDFIRKVNKVTSNGFFITNSIGVCSEHKLSYKTKHACDINDKNFDSVKVLHLKLELIKQELMNLNNTEEEEPSISNETNSPFCSNSVLSIGLLSREVTNLKKMNDELIKHNDELTVNNKFLRKKMEDENKLLAPISYADSLKQNSDLSYKIDEHVPNIIINAKKPNSKINIYDKVTNQIHKCNNIQIKNVVQKKDGTVKVCCKNKNDIENMKKSLAKSLGDKVAVNVQELKNPRLKIVNIKNSMSLEELQNDINTRNFNHLDDLCTVVHSYKVKNSQCAIIELPSKLYNYVRNNRNYIFIGHQRCRAYDDLNISLCGKCGGLGHSIKKCHNKSKCINCAGDHSVYDCKQNIKRCIHCMYFNTKYKKNRSVEHMASDIASCESLKFKINFIINTTDYPIKPEMPTYLHYKKEWNPAVDTAVSGVSDVGP